MTKASLIETCQRSLQKQYGEKTLPISGGIFADFKKFLAQSSVDFAENATVQINNPPVAQEDSKALERKKTK